ncbi:MAG: hypothetical protein OXS33_02390 [bacterium]|nr:hypothetical protein [bacterium]
MRYTEQEIERISGKASSENLLPAPPEAREIAKEIADAIADSYSEDDWRHVLNTLSPDRAARSISSRPFEDRRRLLMLIEPDRRAEVERHLAAPAA